VTTENPVLGMSAWQPPIWIGDKKFQDNVLDGFKRYFEKLPYFLELFTTAYLAGLKDGGLR
jgi:hypothetical protein